MRIYSCLSVLLVTVLFAGCGGGGGGGDDQEEAPLSVTAVAPPTGPVAGGTQISIQGTGFENEGAGQTSVTLNNTAAAAVNVVSDTLIRATTPPGSVGVRSVTVTNDLDAATLPAAFTYVPPPALNQVQAEQTRNGTPAGLTSGGTRITLVGGRFQVGNPGVTRVTVNGIPATDIVIASDIVLSCTTPASTPGLVTVEVSNDNGIASLSTAFFYRPPLLYGADGKGVSGRLWLINQSNGAGTPIGSGIGHSIDGMAMASDGTMYAVTRVLSPPTSQLLTINTSTGVGTVVADCRTNTGGRCDITGIEFVGGKLYGMAHNFRRPCEIDLITGDVTLFEFTNLGSGEGVAYDEVTDEILFALEDNDDDLSDFDPGTGFSTPVQSLAGTGNNSFFNAMTFLEGTLFASEATRNTNNNTEPTGPSTLTKINPVTGGITSIGSLPDSIDALAGNFR